MIGFFDFTGTVGPSKWDKYMYLDSYIFRRKEKRKYGVQIE